MIVEPPPDIPKGYPSTLMFSKERYNNYVATWVRFATQYNVPFTPPAVDSVLMIPTSWPYQVDLFVSSPDTVTLQEARRRLCSFIDEWPDLFNTTSSELKDTNGADLSPGRYIFHPTRVYPYGENVSMSMRGAMIVVVTHSGLITTLNNDCAPTMELPTGVNFDGTYAKNLVNGKKLYYYDWTGLDSTTLSDANITGVELAAAMIDRYSASNGYSRVAIEYRRTWRITSTIFDVYVDAVTGEDLKYEEMKVIF